jgi:hypothetical protein
MQRHEHREPVARVERAQHVHDAARRFGVERGDGFVGEDDLRALHERSRKRRALLLAARKRRGAFVGVFRNAHFGQRVERHRARVARKVSDQPPPQRQPRERADQHVGLHREPRDEVELLEHEADVAANAAHLAHDLAVLLDRAAHHGDLRGLCVTRREARDVAQQRRLARARRADERDHLAGLDAQIDFVERLAAVAEGLRQAFDANGVHHSSVVVSGAGALMRWVDGVRP